jgi:hypothetical protein
LIETLLLKAALKRVFFALNFLGILLFYNTRRQEMTFTFNTMRRAVIASAVLAAAGFAQAQTVKLSLGHGAALDNPRHIASLKFAEIVKAKTNGQVEVTVSPSGQLGNDAAQITALALWTSQPIAKVHLPMWCLNTLLLACLSCLLIYKALGNCSMVPLAKSWLTKLLKKAWLYWAIGTTAFAT